MRRRIHVSYEEEDTCVIAGGGYMCHMRRRIHVAGVYRSVSTYLPSLK
jgi:hypothetical protein